MATRKSPPKLATAQELLQRGLLDEAEVICRRLIKRDKKNAGALHMLGGIMGQRGRFDEAVDCFQRGLRIDGRSVLLWCALAKTRMYQGRLEEATAAYDEALRGGLNIPAVAGKAEVLQLQGRHDDARILLEPVVAAGTEDGEVASIYASLLQLVDRHHEAVALLQKHLSAPNLQGRMKVKLLYGLGSVLEQLEDYDQAFIAFQTANGSTSQFFDIAQVRKDVDATISSFSEELLADYPRSSNESEAMVFLVGMPQCGSKLVEGILDSHSEARGLGETQELAETVRGLATELRSSKDFPEFVADVDCRTLDRLSHRSLAHHRQVDPDARRLIDKALNNYGFLGFIELLYPKARVIHCRRDPVAQCTSCYLSPLAPEMHPYSTDLVALGHYHREYERLMEHWGQVLSLPILEVRYEDIAVDPEGTSRRILEFCGLEWEDACCNAFESERPGVVDRYKHYEDHLGPLVAALGGGGLLDGPMMA